MLTHAAVFFALCARPPALPLDACSANFNNSLSVVNSTRLTADKPELALESASPHWHASAAADDQGRDKKEKKGPAKSAPPKSGDGQKAPQPEPSSTWSLVLGTFTGADHKASAERMLDNLRTIAPEAAAGARVHTTAKGSMVVFGRYTGRDDPNAVADEQRLKRLTHQNRKVFNRLILTRLDLRLTEGQLHPHDLLSARRAHPKVDPLYTLDVAIWMANEDPAHKAGDRLMYEEAKRQAEAHAAKLRAQGYEAYFYHDQANKRSIVTVGLFDRTAINSTSGLYSSRVTDLVKKFPARLANGEPAFEFIDKYFPKLGTKPQTPVLVLVPTM